MAVSAVIFALRRPPLYTELDNPRIKFDTDGGPVEISVTLTTASHAPRLFVSAKVEIDRVKVALLWKPVDWPTNYGYRAVNSFHLVFIGDYPKPKKPPTWMRLVIHAKLSDGSSARFRGRIPIVKDTVSVFSS